LPTEVVAGEWAVVESLDEVVDGDTLEVSGSLSFSASSASPGAASCTPPFDVEASRKRWRDLVTGVLSRQRDPEQASAVLSVLRRGATQAGEASKPPLVLSVDEMELLRRVPQAVLLLHTLGYRKTSDERVLALDPATAASADEVRVAITEVIDGQQALIRLLAMATLERKEREAETTTTVDPSSLRAAASVGESAESDARREVHALASSLDDEAKRPVDRRVLILPNPRARVAPPPPTEEEDEDDDDLLSPQNEEELEIVARSHRHRLEVAQGGIGNIRARQLHSIASASKDDQMLRIRLMFPDQVTVEGTFGALEPVENVLSLVQSLLEAGSVRLHLPEPQGGMRTLQGSSPLCLAGIKPRSAIMVRPTTTEAVRYVPRVRELVADGGGWLSHE
jgi:hypothetical protein